ncbi:helix-turn-helix transcriptional regulator [Flavisolibacter sp. BT320]|nr:helix-turn-helix transcriptional regulator [Flavisolibacter longurius]
MAQSDYLIKLGEKIAEKRTTAGLSQNALAIKCEMDRQNMHKIEKGMVNISMLTLKKIADALNISAKELLDF